MRGTRPPSPATVIRACLHDYGIASPPAEIRKLLHGGRITKEAAQRLLFHFGLGLDYWLGLQRDYDLYSMTKRVIKLSGELYDATGIDWDRSDTGPTREVANSAARRARKLLKDLGWK